MKNKIYVVFHSEDDGQCQQLFKVVNKEEYYARGSGGSWYTISDPFGYAELSQLVRNEIEFVVCDELGKHLFSSSNGDPDSKFPFLKKTCILEWTKLCEKIKSTPENVSAEFLLQAFGGSTNSPLNKWLLSFKDPESYGKSALDYDENWVYFKSDIIQEEVLHTFYYCGRKTSIKCQLKKHKICDATWKEFYSGEYYMASQFDEKNHGPMYAKREAVSLAKQALKEIYRNEDKISYIDSLLPHCERKVTYEKAAEILLKSNYNRKKVMEVIEQEQAGDRHFYANRMEIEAVYGNNYIPSYMLP